MKAVAAFISGLLFAAGLVISGMTQPANVVGFLDFFGEWKPALAFVMMGAVGVYAALSRLVLRRRAPLFEGVFEIRMVKRIDARLLAGSTVFGIGWGLGGFCPGPVVVALATGAREAIVFFVAMIAGILIHRAISCADDNKDETACG